jgi:hypothetical protein
MDHKPFAIKWIETAPAGSTIYVVQRHVSASGMTRILEPFVIVDGDIRYLRGLADDDRMPFKRNTRSYHNGFVVHGAGMDMHFHLVYTIGRMFRGDGYHFNDRTV